LSKYLLIILGLILGSWQISAQVVRVGTKKVAMNINGSLLKIPYYSNLYLDEEYDEINAAVVVVHGSDRNADDYYYRMKAAADMRPEQSDSTIIISPQFLAEVDIDYHSLDNEHLFWSTSSWKSGSNSLNTATNPRPERIPSYAILDTIIFRLCKNLPGLKTIVITGHSAGGQVVTRYAATSSMVSVLSKQYNLKIKFIVANPSSYLYLDNQRVKAGTYDQFEVPDNSCPDYNDWRYGLDNLYTYPSIIGADSIRNTFRKREVIYLLGEYDRDPNSSSLDKSCKAMLQGQHRLERGSVYYNYLLNYYGDDLRNFHFLDTIPGVGHYSLGMYSSEIGLCHLFELDKSPGECSSATTNINNIVREADIIVYPNPSSGILFIRTGQGIRPDNLRIELFNIMGDRLLVLNKQTELDLNNLLPGIYIIKIISDNLTRTRVIVLND